MLRVPRGYIIAHEAILRVTKARNPALWKFVRPDESTIWQTSCQAFDGRFLLSQLEAQSLSSQMPKRYAEYADARQDFKEWLQDLNTFEALCCSVDWFFDNNDEEARKIIIDVEFWREAKADEALTSSKFAGGYDVLIGEMIVIFRAKDIDDLEAGIEARRALDAQYGSKSPPPRERKRVRATEDEVRSAFQARIEGWPIGAAHPSEPEDRAAIEGALGKRIDRAIFRKVRREVAPRWVARGRPPKEKSARK